MPNLGSIPEIFPEGLSTAPEQKVRFRGSRTESHGKEAFTGMSHPLTVAAIGFWHVHAGDYARNVQQHPDTTLVAVWDDDERARPCGRRRVRRGVRRRPRRAARASRARRGHGHHRAPTSTAT